MSDYITGSQLLATLGITNPSSQQTSDANAAVDAASRAIDNMCNRSFAAAGTAVSTYYYSPVDWQTLDIHDCTSVTTLFTRDDGIDIDTSDGGGQTWTLNTDFFLLPLNADGPAQVETKPYTSLQVNPIGSYTFNIYYPRSVKLTGVFGWPATPPAIIDATTLLAERLFKMKREAPLGVLAFSDVAIRIARADSNLMILVGPYVKHRAALG